MRPDESGPDEVGPDAGGPDESDPDEELYRLAKIGAPRGLRGEVRLIVHTDNPAERLAPGSTLRTDPPERGPLEVAELVERDGRWFARFRAHPDRTSVESLTGTMLLAEASVEEDAWYPRELVGLHAERPTGEHVGEVAGVEHYPGHDMLVLTEPGGQRTLVPFVEEIVPRVDVEGGVVVIDPPVGLLAADGDRSTQGDVR